jgi:hypothetical protein
MPGNPELPIITQAEAKACGLKRFFIGLPCRNGHVAEHYSSHGGCVACVALRNIANKESKLCWQREHPKEMAASRLLWLINNREKDAASRALYERNNRPTRKITRTKTPEKFSVYDARYRSTHPERVKASSTRYRAAHPETDRAHKFARRAAEANPSWADQKAIAAMFASRPLGYHVDHIIPLGSAKRPAKTAEGYPIRGLNVPWNLTHSRATINLGKQHRMTMEEQFLCELPFTLLPEEPLPAAPIPYLQ